MQPGSPAALVPPGEDWLVRRVQEFERQVAELAAVNPVVPTFTIGRADAFAIPAPVDLVTVEIVVPPGMTKVVLSVHGFLTAKNTTASENALSLSIWAASGATGGYSSSRERTPAGNYCLMSASTAALAEGLAPGDVVSCQLQASALAAVTADADNAAFLRVVATWFH